MYVDSHAHIEMEVFDPDREQVIERARRSGIDIIVNVGNGDLARDSHLAAFRIAERYRFIYATVGIHPHEARLASQDLYLRLAELSNHPKVIAWGEIGLDYHYDNSPRDVQRQVFRRQLELARERRLPVVIHTREAEADTLAILRDEWSGSGLPGVIHCFTGSEPFAESAIQMGFYISFSGIVTFKKSDQLRGVAGAIPLDRILIETDSPFLAPEPHRGRRNEPAFVLEVARKIAELRGLQPEEVGRVTSENFKRAFPLFEAVGGASDNIRNGTLS
jgi:TatD DNase family protein